MDHRGAVPSFANYNRSALGVLDDIGFQLASVRNENNLGKGWILNGLRDVPSYRMASLLEQTSERPGVGAMEPPCCHGKTI